MPSVREQVLKRFHTAGPGQHVDDDISAAVYAFLYMTDAAGLPVDGWETFYVRDESIRSLLVVGLMTLLPKGSVPIEVFFENRDSHLEWRVSAIEWSSWQERTEAKRWNAVYLYATNASEEPSWEWSRSVSGALAPADA